MIVLVGKEQARYIPLLAEHFPLPAVLTLPVTERDIEAILGGTNVRSRSSEGAGTRQNANDDCV
ncbi:hypothetical protein F2Q65_17785 [Thiohalocapsa marina]|uniref:Uncharacterized protein n=1 Tax=Thiohalocapsa marina TaxID=424902 RepID=A0A5M8FHF6_9GAMM|nr:hypothetical protein [Thiohalocapsa marina]KAA6182521.1 hypothetical protein F2Q65_17785 [Thiohalocapsa marina]